jgi:hypothetical protein
MKIGNYDYKISGTGWKTLGKNGVSLENNYFRLDANSKQPSCIIDQTLTFDPPIQMPILLSAKCKGDIIKMSDQCALFLDIQYADKTFLWGIAVDFPNGKYDFQERSRSFMPTKPIQTIKAYLLLRHRAEGTAWFDQVYIASAPLELSRFQTLGGLFGKGSVVAAARPEYIDPKISTEIKIQQPNSASILFKKSSFHPSSVFVPPDNKTEQILVTCYINRNSETFVTSKLVNTEPCDNGRGYCVWTATSMERLFPYSFPRTKQDFGNRKYYDIESIEEQTELRARLKNPTASVELAKNEYESFQIGILSPTPLENVQIIISDLTLESDKNVRIDSKHLDWKQIGFIRADSLQKHPFDNEGGSGWFPDPLLPVDHFDIPAGQTQPVWVTVYAPKDAQPGKYNGTVSIVPKNAQKTVIPVSVHLWNYELADEGHFQTAFALMDGYLEKVYGTRPTSPELRKRYGDFMLQHRLTPEGDISRTAPPVLEELEYYRGRGLGTFNILNMVEERGDKTSVCNSPPEVYTPEFKEKILKRLKPYIEELRQRGLSKNAYIYTFDESTEEYANIMTDFFGTIKEHFPEVRTSTTAYFVHTLDQMKKMNVDWTCPKTQIYDFKEAEKCRRDGRQVWAYICCDPDFPYANIMCRFPLIESRLIFWQAFHEKFDGLLYWGVNIWNRKGNIPIDPKQGAFLDWSIESHYRMPIYGDGRLIYAGKNGQPIGSIRLANLRDGLEDYEYLYLIQEKNKSWAKARQFCQPIVPSLTNFTRNPAQLYQQRQQIILELLKQINSYER